MVNSKGIGSSNHATNGRSSKRGREEHLDDSNPHPVKRSRVSRACDQCRASRERCDGVQPTCQTCASQDRTCSYNEQPKKRGIQPNYIRTLELALAWLFKTFPDAEETLTRSLPHQSNRVRDLVGSKDPEASEELHQLWRDCLANKQIDQMLSGSTVDQTGLLVSSRTRSPPQVSMASYNSPPLSASIEHTSVQQDDPATDVANMISSTQVRYRLPPNAWTLLEYYFAFTHSWLPMTGKHSILKTMYSYPPEGLPFDDIKTAEHAELWSILALAAYQTSGDAGKDEVEQLRHLADSLLPTGSASYEVPHIRAMILLALNELLREQLMAAWLRIGTAVRILHLFKLIQELGPTARWCRHVHLVAFVIESALAQRLKTRGHFRLDYITGIGVIDEDGIDEWAPWADPLQPSESKAPVKAFSTLNQLVRLYMRTIDDGQSGSAFTDPASDANGSVVTMLLQNTVSKQQRVQPSQLVATYYGSNMADINRNWSTVGRPDLDPTWSIANIVPPQRKTADLAPSTSRGHAFITMPNEGDQFSSTFSPADGVTAYGDTESPFQSMHSFPEPDNASMDIFEELATLERQDSIHRPQFMQNLGFPDLDLAEFFGPDYQPSDPLLTYLQPAQLQKLT